LIVKAIDAGNVGIGNTIPNVTLGVSGNVNVSGRLSYGTLAANSPHFLETAGQPEPLCVKAFNGKYVGCMVDDNFEFTCKIDDRCSRKYLDAKLAEEVEKLGKKAAESKASVINNQNAAANQITSNAVNEAGLETDLSSILEPASNAASSTTAETTSEASIIFENNSNVQTSNASGDNADTSQINQTIQQQTEEQSGNEIEDDSIINQKIGRLIRIRSDIKEKKVTVKQAIERLKAEKLKHIDLDEIEDEETAEAEYKAKKSKEAPAAQTPQTDYMTKINGSVIIKLG